jgi:hypothetical protein
VRWRPESADCAECGFAWTLPYQAAVATVAGGPAAVSEALHGVASPTRRSDGRWSATMYVWHLVDVVRFGTERLLTIAEDPERGIPCWDENDLAAVRKYERLSPRVGLLVFEMETRLWLDAAAIPAEATVAHPLFGELGAAELVRRTAHEVHHHTKDVAESP